MRTALALVCVVMGLLATSVLYIVSVLRSLLRLTLGEPEPEGFTVSKTLASKVKAEIAVALGAVLAAVNALQLLAVPLPSWAHAVIVVATTVAATLGIRSNVTPA